VVGYPRMAFTFRLDPRQEIGVLSDTTFMHQDAVEA
jgi:hypothetical protein